MPEIGTIVTKSSRTDPDVDVVDVTSSFSALDVVEIKGTIVTNVEVQDADF